MIIIKGHREIAGIYSSGERGGSTWGGSAERPVLVMLIRGGERQHIQELLRFCDSYIFSSNKGSLLSLLHLPPSGLLVLLLHLGTLGKLSRVGVTSTCATQNAKESRNTGIANKLF
jgi:hypothetical protein